MTQADPEDSRPNTETEPARVALAQERRAGLSDMLRSIAGSVGAAGSILWMETPHAKLTAEAAHSELFVLADWFARYGRRKFHNLPLISPTGQAILNDRTVVVNLEVGSRIQRSDPFLKGTGIRSYISTPLTFSASTRGALTTYRKVISPFSPQEIALHEELAHLLPGLYDAISDRASYRLVRQVTQILQVTDSVGLDSRPAIVGFRGTATALCRKVADTFGTLETSLFLEDFLEAPGVFRLAASTRHDLGQFVKRDYRGTDDEGLTGWVLNHGKSLSIRDLSHLERDRSSLQIAYPGLSLKEPLVEKSARSLLGMPAGATLPPMSLMASPVVVAGRTLGTIRCVATHAPPWFEDRDLEVLELIASQIGQAWLDRLRRWEIEEENRTWQRLVKSLGDLNRFVEKQVAAGKTDEVQIFRKALEATASVIQGAEISDVRLLDKQRRELYFKTIFGEAWGQGTPTEIRQRQDRRFPIDGDPPPSAGAYVMQTGKVYVIPDTSDPQYFYSHTFGASRRMIVAPIGVDDDILGVLDIRAIGDRQFPPHAERVAELLGQQLAVYYYIVGAINELQRLPEEQAQTFEDLTHQLKSPLFQVHARIQNAVRLMGHTSSSWQLEKDLLAIRGLAAKAKRVVQGLGLFASLARGKEPHPQLERLLDESLIKALVEAAIDQEIILDPRRELRFHVDREGFQVLRTKKVEADIDLVLQAVINLLDNAAKYSFSRSVVRIYGGLTVSGRFHISVGNRGLPITPEEIAKCNIRGWRSSRAQEVTGEGSGIGLWIIDHIMKVHGGELLILPTNQEQWTEVKLVFPARETKREG